MAQFDPNFEAIYAGLFTLLQTAAGFKIYDRLLRHWADVESGEQPALFMPHGNEVSHRTPGLPAVWTIDLTIWLYAQASDQRSPTSLILNPLIGAVRGLIVPESFGVGRQMQRQTLGGLVGDVWIEGKINTDEGFLGQQGVAQIPIHILVNG